MAPQLPQLFFVHFEGTSFVAEDNGELVGFLCGFLSQTDPGEAFIHVVGVAPSRRASGLGRELYERFFAAAREHGRTVVRCVASPDQAEAVEFHEAMGFRVDRVAEDYEGPGEDRMLFVRHLG